MMLFSATYKTPVIDFATKIVKEPMIIRLRRQDESLASIKQMYVKCQLRKLKKSCALDPNPVKRNGPSWPLFICFRSFWNPI